MSNTAAPQGRAIISTIGHDRPGLVSGLASLVTELGLSIEDSRMSALGGEFAVMMSVTGASQALATLETQLAEYCKAQALAFMFRGGSERRSASATTYEVTVTAMDHPGIVRSVAAFFSDRQLNIRDLATDTEPAPHTGTPLFNLQMTVEVPVDTDSAVLLARFADFCAEEDLDGKVTPQG